jgi:hypothetical protein
MTKKPHTAVEWLYDNLKSHFEHNGDLLEAVQYSFEQAKQIERLQHSQTWDAALDKYEVRAGNYMRAYEDFDDYYEQFKKD